MREVAARLAAGALGAVVAFAPPAANASAEETPPTAMLGLDGVDDEDAARVDAALRNAFADRGITGAGSATLAEIRLGLGCDTQSVDCIAQGGEMLGADEVIYGALVGTGDQRMLHLEVVTVESKSVRTSATIPVTDENLAPGRVDVFAAVAVNSLYPPPKETEPAAPPPATALVSTETAAADADPGPPRPTFEPTDDGDGDKKFVWGNYKPRPKWKWAAFGASTGVLVVGVTTYIIASVQLSNLRGDLLDEADRSRRPDDPLGDVNDVDPAISADLCEAARETPAGASAGSVTNAPMVRICNQADDLETVGIAGVSFTVVGAVATAAFTTLLFVHKNKRSKSTARRRVRLAPRGRGGALTLRF